MNNDFTEQLKKYACDWIDNNIDSLLEIIKDKYILASLTNAAKNIEKGKDAYIAKLETELDNQSKRNLIKSLELNENPDNISVICDLFNTKITDLNLSTRTNNALIAIDVVTLGDLCKLNRLDLLKIKGFGRKSLCELDDLLDTLFLSFDMDVDKYYSALYKLSQKDN